MSEFVRTERHGRVLLVQITYEKTLNCLNQNILAELTQILRSYSRDAGPRGCCGR